MFLHGGETDSPWQCSYFLSMLFHCSSMLWHKQTISLHFPLCKRNNNSLLLFKARIAPRITNILAENTWHCHKLEESRGLEKDFLQAPGWSRPAQNRQRTLVLPANWTNNGPVRTNGLWKQAVCLRVRVHYKHNYVLKFVCETKI